MELVGRMMDGSIPYSLKGLRPGTPSPKVGQDEKIEHLQRVPIFEGCTSRQLRAIARITDVMDLPEGAVITRVGEPGDQFFLIIDGFARVEVSPEKKGQIRPGDFFGEMSLLDGGPRSANVFAETAVHLLVIERRAFWSLLKDVPALTQKILATLSQRVRQAEQSLRH